MAEDQKLNGGPTAPLRAPLVGENAAGGSGRASAQNALPGPDTGAAGRGQLITSALAARLLMVSPERIHPSGRAAMPMLQRPSGAFMEVTDQCVG